MLCLEENYPYMHIELIKKIAAKVYGQDMAENICRQLPGLIALYA